MPPPPPLLLLFFLFLFLLLPASPASSATPATASFSLNFFPAASAIAVAQLALSGGATANATAFPGAISMASAGARVQHRSPILLSTLGFSTYFAFALLPVPAASSPPPSFAFFLGTPSSASRSPPALALAFSARQVRIDLAGRTVLQAPFRPPATNRLHAWIDYNATSAALHLRLSGSAARLPTPPLLSYYPLHLRTGPVIGGFRTSSGNCTLYSWAFRAAPPSTMHSQPLNPADLLTTRSTPSPPHHRVPDSRRYSPSPSPWVAAVSLLFAAACGAMLTFFLLFLCYSVAKRRPVAPVEFPMHPSGSDVVYHKIVLVGAKDDAAAAHHPPSAGNK